MDSALNGHLSTNKVKPIFNMSKMGCKSWVYSESYVFRLSHKLNRIFSWEYRLSRELKYLAQFLEKLLESWARPIKNFRYEIWFDSDKVESYQVCECASSAIFLYKRLAMP